MPALELSDLQQITSNRKKRLFALACCRSIEHLIKDQRSKDLLNKFELLIDGKINEKEFESIRQNVLEQQLADENLPCDDLDPAASAYSLALDLTAYAYWAAWDVAYWAARATRIDYDDYHERTKLNSSKTSITLI